MARVLQVHQRRTVDRRRFASWSVSSDVALPQLPVAGDAAQAFDCRVRRASAEDRTAAAPLIEAAAQFRLSIAGAIAVMMIDDVMFGLQPDRIWWHDEARTPPDMLAHLIVDHALPRWLALRGTIVLHATAAQLDIGTNSGGVAFIGPSGIGKSTMLAALLNRGGSIIADDALVLEPDATGALQAIPTYSATRLWGDSHRYFGGVSSQAHAMSSGKSLVEVRGSSKAAMPLLAVVELAVGDTIEVTRHGPSSAVGRIISANFLGEHNGLSSSALLERALAVACCVPVATLRYPRRFETTESTVDVLINWLEGCLSTEAGLR